MKKLTMLVAIMAMGLLIAAPAIAQVGQEGEQEGESGEVDQSFTVTGSGSNGNSCAPLQGSAQSGNSQNQGNVVQERSASDDFEFDEVGSDIASSGSNSTECIQEVNQAASAAAAPKATPPPPPPPAPAPPPAPKAAPAPPPPRPQQRKRLRRRRKRLRRRRPRLRHRRPRLRRRRPRLRRRRSCRRPVAAVRCRCSHSVPAHSWWPVGSWHVGLPAKDKEPIRLEEAGPYGDPPLFRACVCFGTSLICRPPQLVCPCRRRPHVRQLH